jgi:hypothetical protein
VKQRQEGTRATIVQGVSPDPHVRIVVAGSERTILSLARNDAPELKLLDGFAWRSPETA